MRVGIDGEITLPAAVYHKTSELQRGCCCTRRQALRCQSAVNAGRDRWSKNSGCAAVSIKVRRTGVAAAAHHVKPCGRSDQHRVGGGSGGAITLAVRQYRTKYGEPAWWLLHSPT